MNEQPRYAHHNKSASCVFLGHFGDYDLYVYAPNASVAYYEVRWGSNANQHWSMMDKYVQAKGSCPYRGVLTEAMKRYQEGVTSGRLPLRPSRTANQPKAPVDSEGPRWAHRAIRDMEPVFLGRHADTIGDYDLYVHKSDGDRQFDVLAARFGAPEYAFISLYAYCVPGENSRKHIGAIREALRRSEEKAYPEMTLHIDVDGQRMTGGHNIQSIPKEKLRDLSSEEPLFIDDKLQGAFDTKNRRAGMGCANMNYLEMEMVRAMGVPPAMLGIATLPPSPGPFLKGRYTTPLHAFGLAADHPGFRRPAPPAKVEISEERPTSLFGSDVSEAHTKESDDRRERFRRALRHNFPPALPFGDDGDTCRKAMQDAAAELRLTSELRVDYNRRHDVRKHTVEWHFIDRMERPAFHFQARFWAEAPTKEEAWKTLEAGVMAFAGKE